jgi:mRNA interferase RelE/StbE
MARGKLRNGFIRHAKRFTKTEIKGSCLVSHEDVRANRSRGPKVVPTRTRTASRLAGESPRRSSRVEGGIQGRDRGWETGYCRRALSNSQAMSSSGGAATQICSQKFDQCFHALPKVLQERIQRRIDELGLNLRDFQHRRLQGVEAFKLRAGDYRVIYEFNVDRNELFLLTVGNRRDIYKKTFN